MKKLTFSAFILLAWSFALPAQTPRDRPRPEPNIDDVAAHLNLTDAQISCLEANKQAFRDAARPTSQQLRDLQRQVRQAARDGAETAGLQAQIDTLRSEAEAVRSNHVASGQSCLDPSQTAALNELIAAETLANEVRQGVGLMLIQPTQDRVNNAAASQANDRRGRGRPNRSRRRPGSGRRPAPDQPQP